MKVLYVINTGLVGGLQRHVLCLMEALKGIADTAVVINTEINPQLVPMFQNNTYFFATKGLTGMDLEPLCGWSKVCYTHWE